MNTLHRFIVWVLATGAVAAPLHAQNSNLTIVVLEGEGAVNIVQQRTATAPVVEVRDRNDQPVAGAVVTFVIRSGRASFNGARTFTATTNAVGRVTALNLTPSGTGAVQIGATASFQGQTATAIIAQTNAATAAAAGGGASGAAAGGGAGATGGGAGGTATAAAAGGGAAAAGGAAATTAAAAGGTAAATGGGLSALAIGGIVAGVGGGAVVAAETIVNDEPSETTTTFTGPLSIQVTTTHMRTFSTGNPQSCSSTFAQNGTIRLTLTVRPDGSVTGKIGFSSGTEGITSSTCSYVGTESHPVDTSEDDVTGTTTSFGVDLNFNETGPTSSNGTVNSRDTVAFHGSLSGGVVTGTYAVSHTGTAVGGLPLLIPGAGTLVGYAEGFAGSVNVTLR